MFTTELCDMQFLKIDLEKQFLHIIECRGPLLFCRVHITLTGRKSDTNGDEATSVERVVKERRYHS